MMGQGHTGPDYVITKGILTPELILLIWSHFGRFSSETWKTVKIVDFHTFSTFAEKDAPRTLKVPSLEPGMNTTRSDEESSQPRVTLSFHIPSLTNGPARCSYSGLEAPVKWP